MARGEGKHYIQFFRMLASSASNLLREVKEYGDVRLKRSNRYSNGCLNEKGLTILQPGRSDKSVPYRQTKLKVSPV
jgi:hypothetical protein